jgi:hypothetical protein
MRQLSHTAAGSKWRRAIHLRNRLAVWASNATDQVRDAWPDMPEGIADRNADVWEALFFLWQMPLAESGPIGRV